MYLKRQSNITFSSFSKEHFIIKLDSNRTVIQEVSSTCLRFKSPLNLRTILQKNKLAASWPGCIPVLQQS